MVFSCHAHLKCSKQIDIQQYANCESKLKFPSLDFNSIMMSLDQQLHAAS